MKKNSFKKTSIILFISSLLFSCSLSLSSSQYFIKFEENGGTPVGDFVLDVENFYGFSEETILDNFTFIGWFFDDNYTNEFSLQYLKSNFKPKKTITLYAYWIDDSTYLDVFTVNFIISDLDIISQEYAFYQTIIPPIEFSKPYAIFDGWYLDSDFKEPIDLSNFKVQKDLRIYAKWIQKYELIYDLLGSGRHLIYFTDTEYVYTRESISLSLYSSGYLVEDLGGYKSKAVIDYSRIYQTGGQFPKESNLFIEIDYENPDYAYFSYGWGDLFDNPSVGIRGKWGINKTRASGPLFVQSSYGSASRINEAKELAKEKINLVLDLINIWNSQLNISWD